MRKSILFLVGFFFMLSGCAAHDAKINPMLNSIRNEKEAIYAFGPPQYASQMSDGASIYVWSTSSSYTGGGLPIYQPNHQTHSGNIYSPSGRYAGSYSGTTVGTGQITYTPTYQVNLQCELRMIIEASGAIRTWSYQGNACDRLIVNANSPSGKASQYTDTSGNARGLNDCLAEQAQILVKQSRDAEEIIRNAEEICAQKTGGRIPNLARYYANQALER